MLSLVALALLSGPPAPFRWAEPGHRILCEVAWLRLTPEARTLVLSIRAADPDSADSFAGSCLWADRVRSTTHPFTYSYHFVNIPARVPGMDMTRDCGVPARRCAVWAIRHYTSVLLHPWASPLGKAEALKFVAHFVGDLHQPLHAGRPEDLGGNTVLVDFFGQRRPNGDSLNLHGVWDFEILQRAGYVWPATAVTLSGTITPALAARWRELDPLVWANESYRLAESVVYRLPSAKRIREAYYRRALEASRVRLQQAGVRLAELLNRLASGTLRLEELGAGD